MDDSYSQEVLIYILRTITELQEKIKRLEQTNSHPTIDNIRTNFVILHDMILEIEQRIKRLKNDKSIT